jgi:hypothetical protein
MDTREIFYGIAIWALCVAGILCLIAGTFVEVDGDRLLIAGLALNILSTFLIVRFNNKHF